MSYSKLIIVSSIVYHVSQEFGNTHEGISSDKFIHHASQNSTNLLNLNKLYDIYVYLHLIFSAVQDNFHSI